MVIRRSPPPQDAPEIEELQQAVRTRLPSSDEVMVRIVAAVAGLLGAIAYADRDHSSEEKQHIRQELARIDGLKGGDVDAILDVLERHMVAFASKYVQRFTRTLTEETSVDMRRQVLDVALGVAAADCTITHDEITNLRNLTGLLGLSQQDYNALQSKYRQYLHFVES